MQEKHWNLITKHLSNETSEEENALFAEKIVKKRQLKENFEEIKTLWGSLNNSKNTFDKERILKLISFKIAQNKKRKRNKILYASYKYAAVFIGLLIITTFVFRDLRNVELIVNNTEKVLEIKLPDNSIVSLNKDAKIEYNNSSIKGFDREINIEGEAFFEIAKSDNEQFTVHTPDFDINVLGTKFNVRTYKQNQSVVLTEGKIRLNNFQNSKTDIIMKPGEIVRYNKESEGFIYHNINSKIYTSWLSNKLEFDSFTLNELAELIKLRYNKELVIKNSGIAEKQISGSAPADDISLIIQALETILNTKIIQEQNLLIIN